MDNPTSQPVFAEMQQAAEMAVFRLYGYLGAGERLVKALSGLAGTSNYVASLFNDQMDIFEVSVLEGVKSDPVRLKVVHAPSHDSVYRLSNLPETTPGHWSAVLQSVKVGGPFSLAALTIEGLAMDLSLVTCDTMRK